MPITRRRLLTASGAGLAGGGAAAVLAACGSEREDPSSERDAELLTAAAAAQTVVADLYRTATGQSLEREAADAVAAFGGRVSDEIEQLETAIEAAGGESGASDAPQPPAAENVLEAIKIALTDAIAACHAAVGLLSTSELRRLVYEVMATDSAQLAVVRGLLGEEQTPDAFVTGAEESPPTGKPEGTS